MIRIRILALSILLVIVQSLTAQDTLSVRNDSTQVITIEDFFALILQNHPTVKQASLLTDMARQEIRLARGSFDPKLEAQYNTKNLNGKEYFDIFNGSLKFPTVFPIDPTIGFDKNKGPYLNPERYIDEQFNYQQFYAGVSLPLGRGLITDERRTALRQAELFKDMTEAEQVKVINKVLLDASKLYWNWYFAFHNNELFSRSVAIAGEIFDRVKKNHAFGEASAVDTLQARITLQQRIIEQQESAVQLQNAGVQLSNMLWDSLSNPIQFDDAWIPKLPPDNVKLRAEDIKALADRARIHHPELRKIEVKMDQLETERRLAAEYLKPQLNVNYYAINQPINPSGEFSFVANDNYKLGIDFSFPLFLRKERSKLALTKLKLSNTTYERSLTERQIINDITVTYNELATLQAVLSNQEEMVRGYERLLEAELLNLSQGESDLFKINIQQEKLIQSQTKLLKLVAENEKLKAHLYWAAGTYRLQP